MVSPDLRTFNDAAPLKLAVMVLAVKLPEASRATIELDTFAAVALVASVTVFVLLLTVRLVSVEPSVLKRSVEPDSPKKI